MLVFRIFCLTTEQEGIINCHTGKFFSREVVANKLNMYPFVHKKSLSNMDFYRNFGPFGCSDSGGCTIVMINTSMIKFLNQRFTH